MTTSNRSSPSAAAHVTRRRPPFSGMGCLCDTSSTMLNVYSSCCANGLCKNTNLSATNRFQNEKGNCDSRATVSISQRNENVFVSLSKTLGPIAALGSDANFLYTSVSLLFDLLTVALQSQLPFSFWKRWFIQRLIFLQRPLAQLRNEVDARDWALQWRNRHRRWIYYTHACSSSSSSSSPSSLNVHRHKPMGLFNHGQTCFLNSVLQALSSLPLFSVYLHSIVDWHLDVSAYTFSNSKIQQSQQQQQQHDMPLFSQLIVQTLDLLNSIDDNDDGNYTLSIEVRKSKLFDCTRFILHKLASKYPQFATASPSSRYLPWVSLDMHQQQQDALELYQALMDGIRHETLYSIRTVMTIDASSPIIHNKHSTHHRDHPTQYDSIWNNHTLSHTHSIIDFGATDKHTLLPTSINILPTEEETLDDLITLGHLLENMQHLQMETLLPDISNVNDDAALYDSDVSNHYFPTPVKDATSITEEKKLEDPIWTPIPTSTSTSSLGEKSMSSILGEATLVLPRNKMTHVPSQIQTKPPKLWSSSCPTPMTGWMSSSMQCCACHHTRPVQNTIFLELSIVPTAISQMILHSNTSISSSSHPSSSSSTPCLLEQCLSDFSRPETINDVECLMCSIKNDLTRIRRNLILLRETLEYAQKKESPLCLSVQREYETLLQRQQFLQNLDPDKEYNVDKRISSPFHGDTFDPTLDFEILDIHTIPKPLRSDFIRRLSITRLPPILCIHIKRLYYDSQYKLNKCLQHILFSDILDLNETHLGTQMEDSTHFNISYKLMSVIEHQGNAFGGHYVTYKRLTSDSIPKEREWALISDERVSYLSFYEVSRCQAYMLFYEKIILK